MSKAAAAIAVAAQKNIVQNVTSSAPRSPNRLTLFNYIFEPNPKPLNCAVYATTRAIAEDPAHPFHIRTTHRLKAFDASKLHWNVKCPYDMSKKAVVRNWAAKRVKVAFREVMAKRGWAKDGARLDQAGPKEVQEEMRIPLKGAMVINLNKDRSILTASIEEVRRQCELVLSGVVARQGLERKNSRPHQRLTSKSTSGT